jgi:hypothetical protein
MIFRGIFWIIIKLGEFWSGRRDSNPRPQPWQGCALPLSYARLLYALLAVIIRIRDFFARANFYFILIGGMDSGKTNFEPHKSVFFLHLY